MPIGRSALLPALVIGLLADAPPAFALPNPDEPVDPTKRAPISTANAVRPAATQTQGDGVIGGRVIRMSEIPIRRAATDGDRAPIEVRETRDKGRVIKPTAKTVAARKVEVRRAADLPAAIPRIDPERFRQMLRAYEDERLPAADMMAGAIQIGDQRVSLADINRFANPRATLEAQGIPVTPAASGEASAAPESATVPISREKNGDSAARSSASQ